MRPQKNLKKDLTAKEAEIKRINDLGVDPIDDCYAVLGLNENASKKEIEDAYSEKSLLVHPDLNNKKNDARKAFEALKLAKLECLKHIEKQKNSKGVDVKNNKPYDPSDPYDIKFSIARDADGRYFISAKCTDFDFHEKCEELNKAYEKEFGKSLTIVESMLNSTAYIFKGNLKDKLPIPDTEIKFIKDNLAKQLQSAKEKEHKQYHGRKM